MKEMRANYRNSILWSYCDLLIKDKILNQELLDLFIGNRSILSNSIINKINDQLVESYQNNDKDTLKILDEKLIPDQNIKKEMIKQKVISAIVNSISKEISVNNEIRVQTYYRLKDMASQKNQTLFIEKMLSILSEKKHNKNCSCFYFCFRVEAATKIIET